MYEIEIIVREKTAEGHVADEWSLGTVDELSMDNGDTAVETSVDSITNHPVIGQLPMTLSHVGGRPSDRK